MLSSPICIPGSENYEKKQVKRWVSMGENAILRLFQLIAAWMGLKLPPVKLRASSQMSCALKAVDATHESSQR